MTVPAPKPSPDGCAAQTPIDDLERAALAHYDELSSKACHWNSIIPQAIRFYFDAQRRPNPETQAVAEYHAPMVLIESPDYAEYLRTHPSQVPSQETQAVACEHKNADFFNGKLTTTNSRSLYIAWCPDCGAARTTLAEDWLLPRRSPVEAVPVSALRELEEELRKEAAKYKERPCYADSAGWRPVAMIDCADRLSAVIRGEK